VLLENPGDVVSREELRGRLWPDDTFVDFDGSLGTAMNKLRVALCDSANNPRYIETVPRQGYRLVAPVTHISGQPLQQPDSSFPSVQDVNTSAAATESKTPAANSRLRSNHRLEIHSRYRLALVTVALISLSAGSAYLFSAYSRSLHSAGSSGLTGVAFRRSVAVLGFRNLSGRPDAGWLSTALSDWMTTELSADGQLRTLPPETVSRTKTELALSEVDGLDGETLARVRQRVGADFVLTGSYAMLDSTPGGQIRLDVRVQDTRTGETISAATATGSSARLFALVANCGQHLRQALGLPAVTLQEAAMVAMALPSGGEAARLYSEGTSRLRVFDALSARDFLQEAVASEPDFPLSHANLAAAWDQLGYEENARAEAKKALELSSRLSRTERLLIEARYYEMSREWEKAIELYRPLFEFFPDDLDYGLALANTQNSGNKWNDALATVRILRGLPSPLSDDPRIDLVEADAAYSLGDSARVQSLAAQAAEKARATGAFVLWARALVRQATALQDLGRFDEASDPLQKARRVFLAVHDLQAAAEAATLEAAAFEIRGDYRRAINTYRESLALYQTAGNKHAATDEYTHLGEVLLAMGDARAARENYQHALAVSRNLHDQDGIAWATIGLGAVARKRGKHGDAKRMFGQALEIARQTGSRNAMATAISEMGMVLYEEGDVEAAKRNELQGLEVFREIGDKCDFAEYEVELAKISADQGDLAEAESLARKAADEFERERNRHSALAHAVRTRALLEQGRFKDARKAVDQGLAMIRGIPDRQAELTVGIASASVDGISASVADNREAEKDLEKVVKAAHKFGFVEDELEARLVLGKIKTKLGDNAGAREQFQSVEKYATSNDFGRIAGKARAARTGWQTNTVP